MARANDIPPLSSIMSTFADFFRESPFPMKILAPDNRILHANRNLQKLLGYTEEELREMRQLDLIHPADLYRFKEKFEGVVDGTTDYSEVEARHRHPDGHMIPMLLTHMRLPPTRWPPEWILETAVDLSSREDLKKQMIYLQSQQLLGQMARGIAHDFKNLLAVGSLKLQLLIEQTGDDEQLQSTLADTKEVLDRMGKLSRDLTHFGRAQDIDTTPLNINDAIRSMTDYFDYICPNSIGIELYLDRQIPIIDAAEPQFEQVLLNLVVNARDAILQKDRGTIRISTSTAEIEESDELDIAAGRYALVEVRDDGVGMDEQMRNRIFEPFFSTKGTSTGIGLSTVYAIVEQGRGYIEVDSAPGEGTSVSIYLPGGVGRTSS